MNSKLITILAVSAAVIAAAVAAITVSINRSNAARAYKEAAASEEATAEADKKAALSEEAAEAAKRRTAEANEKAKAAELEAQKIAAEKAVEERKAAEANAEARKAEAEAAKHRSEEAKAIKESNAALAKKARDDRDAAYAVKDAEAAKAKAAADKLETEKIKAEKILAEARALELRQVDFDTLSRELAEWKHDLEERERALTPEKTITDLSWAGGSEDSFLDENGNVKKHVKEPYDPEKDKTLPQESRQLAKAERLAREAEQNDMALVRTNVVASLEKLYEAALRKDRPIDADFYRKSLKSLYPDWEYEAKK